MPTIYKIGGAWSNHEGSMLLWNCTLALFTLFALLHPLKEYKVKLIISYIQSAVLAFFVVYTTFTSNPFIRIFPTPKDGLGMNPILQDIGLALHPPILYLGYVGFSVAAAGALAGIILNNEAWIRVIKPCARLSWSLLGAGIILGSWWAYRELGWGGFWFWDPVENSSLIPWILGTAFIHSITSRHLVERWAVLLAILSFISTIVGTFIVRSGVITSVHSFAVDPTRGNIILGFTIIYCLFALGIYMYFYSRRRFSDVTLRPRDIFLNINNVILSICAFTIALGTIYPVLLELYTGHKLSIGAPYYNALIPPLILCNVFICAIGFYTSQGIMYTALRQTIPCFISIAVVFFLSLYLHFSILSYFGTFASIWLICATTCYVYRKLSSRSRINLSMVLGHLGFAFIIMSLCIYADNNKEIQVKLNIGEQIEFNNFKLTLKDIAYNYHNNYAAQMAYISVEEYVGYATRYVTTLKPEIRLFPVEKQQTIEADILYHPLFDLYTNISDVAQQKLYINIYYKPMLSGLWLGAFFIIIAGLYGLSVNLYHDYSRHNKTLNA